MIGRPGTKTLDAAAVGRAFGPGLGERTTGAMGRFRPGGRIGRTGPVGDTFFFCGLWGSGAPGMAAVGRFGGGIGGGGCCFGCAGRPTPCAMVVADGAASALGIAGGVGVAGFGIEGASGVGGRAGLLGRPGSASAVGRFGSGPRVVGIGGSSGLVSPSSTRSTTAVASTGLDFGAGISGGGCDTGGATGGIGGVATGTTGLPTLGCIGGRRAPPTAGRTPPPKGGRNIVPPPPPILMVGRTAAVALRCADPAGDGSMAVRRLRRRGNSSSGSGSSCCSLSVRLRMCSRIRLASSSPSALE